MCKCKSKMKRYVRWIPVVIVMSIIFYFSHAPAVISSQTSAATTSTMLGLFKKWFGVNPFSQIMANSLEVIIRQVAHVVEFMLLAMTFYYAYYSQVKSRKRMIWITLFFSIGYAVTDEIHQIFIPGRAAELVDIITDACGAAVGIICCVIIQKLYDIYVGRKEKYLQK